MIYLACAFLACDDTVTQSASDSIASGKSAFAKGEYEKAISYFEEAIKLDAKLVDGYRGLGFSQLRLNTAQKSTLTSAKKTFKSGLDVSNDLDCQIGLVLISYALETEMSVAIDFAKNISDSYQNSIDKDLSTDDVKYHLSWLYFKSKNYAASETLAKALATKLNISYEAFNGSTESIKLAKLLDGLRSKV